jgi:hypothetical protein
LICFVLELAGKLLADRMFATDIHLQRPVSFQLIKDMLSPYPAALFKLGSLERIHDKCIQTCTATVTKLALAEWIGVNHCYDLAIPPYLSPKQINVAQQQG